MKTMIICHNLELSPEIKNYVFKKFNKISQHFDQVINLEIILKTDDKNTNEKYHCEAIINLQNYHLFAEVTTNNLHDCIHNLLEQTIYLLNIEQSKIIHHDHHQVHHHHDSIHHHHHDNNHHEKIHFQTHHQINHYHDRLHHQDHLNEILHINTHHQVNHQHDRLNHKDHHPTNNHHETLHHQVQHQDRTIPNNHHQQKHYNLNHASHQNKNQYSTINKSYSLVL